MDQWWVEIYQCLRGPSGCLCPLCSLSHSDLVVRVNADLHVSFGGFCLCSRSLGRSLQPADCPCPWPSQIDFLNSVIVDLQRRNEELNSKIQRMCEAALNGNEEEINNYDRYKRQRKTLLCVLGTPQVLSAARGTSLSSAVWKDKWRFLLNLRGLNPAFFLSLWPGCTWGCTMLLCSYRWQALLCPNMFIVSLG